MRGERVGTQLCGSLQWWDRCSVVLLPHVCVAQLQEGDRRRGSELDSFSEIGDGLIEIATAFGVSGGLQEFRRLCRILTFGSLRWQEEVNKQNGFDDHCSDSSMVMN